MEIDLSHAPCEIHSVPLGECGCPAIFVDPDWLEEDSRRTLQAAGRRHAEERDRRLLEALVGPAMTLDAVIDERLGIS